MLTLATVTAGLVATMLTGGVGQREGTGAAVTIHVEEYSRWPAEEWQRVAGEVETIYRAAGVALTWDGPLLLPAHQWPRDGVRRVAIVVVNIDAPFGGDASDTDDVLGRAAPALSRAWVFANRTRDAARTVAVDASVLLARVIAHEIGHLLLSTQKHADRGVMKGHLDLTDVGFFGFTPQQAFLLHDGIRESTASARRGRRSPAS